MVVLAIHGGAGGDGPWKGQTDLDPARIDCMHQVLTHIGSLLENGENATEAVAKAVSIMEDEPLFNAGKGSVIAANGRITMDASIMRGVDKAAGAVINVEELRHPIFAAKMLLEKVWPVMLNSKAADDFGIENGIEKVTQAWLKTALRVAQWERWRKEKWVSVKDFLDGKIVACGSDKIGNNACRPTIRIDDKSPKTIQELLKIHGKTKIKNWIANGYWLSGKTRIEG